MASGLTLYTHEVNHSSPEPESGDHRQDAHPVGDNHDDDKVNSDQEVVMTIKNFLSFGVYRARRSISSFRQLGIWSNKAHVYLFRV